MSNNTKLGEKIRMYRRKTGFSQMQLELATDTSFGSICRIENGKVNPTKETLTKISRVLNLKTTEIADLLDLKIFSTQNLIEAINSFSSHFTLEMTLQTAVDSMFNLFDSYNGGIIVLLNKESGVVHSQTVSNMPKMEKALKFLPDSILKLTVQLGKDIDNYFVKSIMYDKSFQSNNLYDFLRGPINKIGASAIARILGFKIGIAIPIKVDGEIIGSCLYTKRKDIEFSDLEIKLLKSLSKQIGISVVKSRVIEGRDMLRVEEV